MWKGLCDAVGTLIDYRYESDFTHVPFLNALVSYYSALIPNASNSSAI